MPPVMSSVSSPSCDGSAPGRNDSRMKNLTVCSIDSIGCLGDSGRGEIRDRSGPARSIGISEKVRPCDELAVESVGDDTVALDVGMVIPLGDHERTFIVTIVDVAEVDHVHSRVSRDLTKECLALGSRPLHRRGDQHPYEPGSLLAAGGNDAAERFGHDFALERSEERDELFT